MKNTVKRAVTKPVVTNAVKTAAKKAAPKSVAKMAVGAKVKKEVGSSAKAKVSSPIKTSVKSAAKAPVKPVAKTAAKNSSKGMSLQRADIKLIEKVVKGSSAKKEAVKAPVKATSKPSSKATVSKSTVSKVTISKAKVAKGTVSKVTASNTSATKNLKAGMKTIIKTGEKAPDFNLTDKSGKSYSLSSFKGKTVVLYFYPKDDTPGCTIEANEFNEALLKFKKKGAEVVGVSGGNDKTKEKFCTKYNLNFIILSDTDFSVSNAYGVYGEKSFMGRKYMGISRVTFIIKNGKVVKVFDSVSPKGHAEEVLSAI